jgi:hypothetical protein
MVRLSNSAMFLPSFGASALEGRSGSLLASPADRSTHMSSTAQSSASEDLAILAERGFIFGYPLVLMDSLDLYVQHEPPPSAEGRANWLPAPSEPFNLILRMYQPRKAVLDGQWQPPAIST